MAIFSFITLIYQVSGKILVPSLHLYYSIINHNQTVSDISDIVVLAIHKERLFIHLKCLELV